MSLESEIRELRKEFADGMKDIMERSKECNSNRGFKPKPKNHLKNIDPEVLVKFITKNIEPIVEKQLGKRIMYEAKDMKTWKGICTEPQKCALPSEEKQKEFRIKERKRAEEYLGRVIMNIVRDSKYSERVGLVSNLTNEIAEKFVLNIKTHPQQLVEGNKDVNIEKGDWKVSVYRTNDPKMEFPLFIRFILGKNENKVRDDGWEAFTQASDKPNLLPRNMYHIEIEKIRETTEELIGDFDPSKEDLYKVIGGLVIEKKKFKDRHDKLLAEKETYTIEDIKAITRPFLGIGTVEQLVEMWNKNKKQK